MRTPGDHVIVVFGATGDLAGARSSRGSTTSTVPALSRWAIAAPMPRVASVKWLAEIELAARAFGGYFQANRYHIGGQLLTSQAVRSLITWPRTMAWPGASVFPVCGQVISDRTACEVSSCPPM